MTLVMDPLRSQRMPIEDVVRDLVDVLGTHMVAVIGGGASTRAVRAWRDGEYEPRGKDALRLALRVADILATREKKDVIRAWFGGLNHLLNDENPALVISKRSGSASRSVLIAARAFVSQ